eukprot:UN05826
MFQVILHCYENGTPPSHAFSRQKRREAIIKSLVPQGNGAGGIGNYNDENTLNDFEQLLANNHDIKDRELLLDCLYVYGQMMQNNK